MRASCIASWSSPPRALARAVLALVAGGAVLPAQTTGVGRVQVPWTVRASVPAIAVLQAETRRMASGDRRGRQQWAARLTTGANDRHEVRVRGGAPGWTVRLAEGDTRPVPLDGGEVVLTTGLARGYHALTLLLDGPTGGRPEVEALVRTIQVPGGEASARLAPGR